MLRVGKTLFAAASKGVYASNDGGDSWTLPGNGIPDTAYVTALSEAGGYLFAATYDGLYRSQNLGASWVRIGVGRLDPFTVGMATVASDLFVGTEKGISWSRDYGLTWQDATTDAVKYGVYAFASQDGFLFAATDNDGVCRRSLAEIAASTRIAPGPPSRTASSGAFGSRAPRRSLVAFPFDADGDGRRVYFDIKGARAMPGSVLHVPRADSKSAGSRRDGTRAGFRSTEQTAHE